jgi:hypothetical protein
VIIEPNTLAADVTRLEGTVQGSQRKLAIPLSELSRYYKLDLADCTLVGQKLIIEVRALLHFLKNASFLHDLVIVRTKFSAKNNNNPN